MESELPVLGTSYPKDINAARAHKCYNKTYIVCINLILSNRTTIRAKVASITVPVIDRS